MGTFLLILVSGLLMSAIALVGSAALFFKEQTLARLTLPLVALAAGSLIGGALFHMIPAAMAGRPGSDLYAFGWTAAGFTVFLALEQFIHHHHCHHATANCKQPLTYLILFGDGLHNFLGGLAVAGTFLVDVQLGMTTWIAAAFHEVPQELGDFGVLIHGGWPPKRALLANLLSGLMFPVGAVLTYALAVHLNTDFLVAFGAGNFLYIGASDLVPEVNKSRTAAENIKHFAAFAMGLGILLVLAVFGHH